MTHPTRDELVRWRTSGEPAARAALLTHLAACDECRGAYADLVRTEPEPGAAADIDPAVFVTRGLRVYDGRPAPAWWKRRAVWLGVPAAAAAVFLLAVTIPRGPAPLAEPSAEIRGGTVAAMLPAGAIDRVTEFRWSSPIDATRYRVVVRDGARREVLRRETDQESIAVEPSAAAALGTGSYTWVVEARDRNGRVLMVSRPQSFYVR